MKARVLLAAILLSALFPAAASAESGGGGSCMGEAFRVCWRAMPDRHTVFLCLLDNRRTLKEPCKSTMMREASARTRNGVMDRSPHAKSN